ncbi:MAG TPA: DEAD/DEAH box helicase [Chitinispirillaceae bacterium]|nr:DEAD/DEAH box helicase [Chitinispirillaceae bacterium]
MQTFKELGLTAKTLTALEKKGFEEPTEIQALTIPLVLNSDKDIVAQAQTGTGKTAAFGLPLIELLDSSVKHTQALILAPTRELVVQISEEISSLKGNSGLTVAPIYGGQSIDVQLTRLKKGVSIVVGTPGRILDHLSRKTLKLDAIRFLVLDEGDEMLNMGFIEDIETIIESTPEQKRVLLFSATMPSRIRELASKYMREVENARTEKTLTTSLTDQIYFEVSQYDKFEALCRIIDIEESIYGIVFCRTKVEVDELTSKLQDRGYSADCLHGDISQSQREAILRKFKKKHLNLLVATDVAARGIDISNLSHVINYSLPQDPESYIHRIGRTGRAGNQGTAVTFITPSEFHKLGFIKRITSAHIRKKNIPDIDEILSAKMQNLTKDITGKRTPVSEKSFFHDWANQLLTQGDPVEMLAAVLKHSFGDVFNRENYREITTFEGKKRGVSQVDVEGKTRLFIAMGENVGITKRTLAQFITEQAGVPGRLINDIKVYDDFSYATVPFENAEAIIAELKKVRIGKKQLFVEKARPKKDGDDKSRRPRKK